MPNASTIRATVVIFARKISSNDKNVDNIYKYSKTILEFIKLVDFYRCILMLLIDTLNLNFKY